MTDKRLSIRDLNQLERKSVIRTFASAMGLSSVFEDAASAGKIVPLESLVEILSLNSWPSADATDIELAWISRPITCKECPELDGYSVFWSIMKDGGFQIWVGRSAARPAREDAYLRNEEVIIAILAAYGIFVSQEHRRFYRTEVRKRWIKVTLLPPGLLLMALTVVFVMLLENREWSVRNLTVVDAAVIVGCLAGATIGYFAVQRKAPTAAKVLYGVFLVAAAAVLHITPEFIQIGQLSGVGASVGIGFYVTVWKNWDLLQLTGKQIWDDRFRSTYTIFATWAVVTAAGFASYQVLKYAVVGAFLEGDVGLVFLFGMVVFALGEFLRSQISGGRSSSG